MRLTVRKLLGSGNNAGLQGVVISPSLTRRKFTSIVMGMIFAASLIILLGVGNPPLPYRRGQIAASDIRARVSFNVVQEEQTRKARAQAAEAAPNVYRVDRAPLDRIVEAVRSIVAKCLEAQQFDAIGPDGRTLGITNSLYDTVKSSGADADTVAKKAAEALDAIARRGCLTEADLKLERARTTSNGITIADGAQSAFQPLSAVFKSEDLKAAFRQDLSGSPVGSELARSLADAVADHLRPFLTYDAAASDSAHKAAADAVPESKAFYETGDILVRRDSLIDRPELEKLHREHEVYVSTILPRDRLVRIAGMAITVGLLVWVFGSYVSQYQPRVLIRRTRLLTLMALAVLLVAMTRFCIRSSLLHLIPMSLFGMIVAVAYNALFGVSYSLFLAILVGITTGGDFALAVSLFAGTAMGILAIGKVRSRTAPLIAGASAGLGTFVATWGTGLLFHSDVAYSSTLADSAWGLVNGVVCGMAVTVALPFVERTFNVVTQLRLLEIADLNTPLLRRMALEAPGSYSHSLTVGTLAEAAAEAVGADPLLAKAGGYYHDIGKLSKPDYFVENRGTALSRHYDLSPTMSALIIIAHVKDGHDLAKESGLPTPILDIVRQHHGTTLVEYFYREAIEQAGAEAEVSDQTFRYPGPKPQTREAAIVMLADSVESAARTVTEATPGRLESLVRDVTRAKLEDGQFEDCDITIAQLKRLEVSLVKSLAGIFHARIKYPGHEE